jgi:hypothetical protein
MVDRRDGFIVRTAQIVKFCRSIESVAMTAYLA